jgi:hypothetical protein
MLVPVAASERVREARSLMGNQYFLAAVLFELLFFIPLGSYLYSFYPDWSLMYFLDPGTLTGAGRVWLGVIALSSYLLSSIAGFATAAWLVREGRTRTAIMVMAALGAGIGIFSVFTIRQLTQVGTFAEWSALPRTTTALYLHRIGWIIGIDAAVATGVLGTLLRSFGREREAY